MTLCYKIYKNNHKEGLLGKNKAIARLLYDNFSSNQEEQCRVEVEYVDFKIALDESIKKVISNKIELEIVTEENMFVQNVVERIGYPKGCFFPMRDTLKESIKTFKPSSVTLSSGKDIGCESILDFKKINSLKDFHDDIDKAYMKCSMGVESFEYDDAISFIASRVMVESHDFISGDYFFDNLMENVDVGMALTAAGLAASVYSNFLGILLSSNPLTYMLKKTMFYYTAAQAATASACAAKLYYDKINSEIPFNKKVLAESFLIIMIGMEGDSLPEGFDVKIGDKSLNAAEMKDRIKESYGIIYDHMMQDMRIREEKYYGCLVE